MGSTLNPSYTAVVQRPLDTFVSFRRTLERNKGPTSRLQQVGLQPLSVKTYCMCEW